jgi:hypothetical protein
VTVTATDTTGASGSATFSWTISAAGGCGPQQLIQNGGFATGSLTPWTASSGVLTAASSSHPSYPSTDPYLAWIDGYSGKHTDTLSQTVTIPASCTTATLSFWLYIDSNDPTSKAYDTFTTQVLNSSGTVLATLGTLSNQNEGTGYVSTRTQCHRSSARRSLSSSPVPRPSATVTTPASSRMTTR